jgi:hypothetical protein
MYTVKNGAATKPTPQLEELERLLPCHGVVNEQIETVNGITHNPMLLLRATTIEPNVKRARETR